MELTRILFVLTEKIDCVTSKVRLRLLLINHYYLLSYKVQIIILIIILLLFSFSARNPRRPDLMGKTVSAEKLYMHPDYTTRYDWDFCLIKLSKALEFDCKVEPIGRVSKYYKKFYILKSTNSKLKNKYFYVYYQ